jgi:hypothetical protein
VPSGATAIDGSQVTRRFGAAVAVSTSAFGPRQARLTSCTGVPLGAEPAASAGDEPATTSTASVLTIPLRAQVRPFLFPAIPTSRCLGHYVMGRVVCERSR